MKKNYILTFLLATCFFFKVSAQTCPAPSNLVTTNVTGTSAIIAWTSPGGPTTWEIILQPFGSPAPTINSLGIIATSSPYVVTGLTPCTTYEFYVRGVCGPGDLSTWSGPSTFGGNSTINCVAIVTQNTSCNGQNHANITAVASSGSGNYSYTLVDLSGVLPNMVNSTGIFTNIVTGPATFEVHVTDLLTNCSVTSNTITFTPAAPIICSALVNNNTITATATGGAPPYLFSIDGVTYQASSVFPSLTPGIYTVSVSDTHGCVGSSSSVTIQTNPFNVTIGSTLDIPTSTLFVNVIGGVAPYTYNWQLNAVAIPGVNSSTLVINGQGGVYSVTVTDNNGQVANASYFVQDFQPVVATDDTITVYSSSATIVISASSVLSNDFYNVLPVNTNPNSPQGVTLTPLNIPSGFSLNGDGTVSVLPGTASGIYILTYQICSVTNSSYCDTASVTMNVGNTGILMKAFIDLNNNNVQDSGEQNFTLGQFHYEKNNNGILNSIYSSYGDYFISENNVSTYDLSYTIDSFYANQYTLSTSAYADINFDPITGIDIYNFPVTVIPYDDLGVYISPYGASPRPGFSYVNFISYTNHGNQIIPAGTLTFTKNNVVSISNISQVGTTATPNGFTYDFTNLAPNQTRVIYVTMQVPTIPTVALGQLLTNTIAINIPAGDANVSNNNGVLTQTIVGSYDPNDKTESHGGKIVHSTFTSTDYLTYTIQFENTGTYYAENVRVNDLLDTQLDETSLRMINASHAYNLTRIGEDLNWNFNGVDLQ
ncbi:MAG: fibronectin type III domain-containing protein, partial [Flavobacterium sp.]